MDTKALRNALGCFATGIAVVTTVGEDGAPVGLTVNSFSSVSLDPPLVLFSLDRKSSSREAFVASGRYAVNVLRDDQVELSNRFAFFKGDRWADLDFERDEAGCPVFPGVLAAFHCKVVSVLGGGDHEIFLGEVVDMRWDPQGDPLIYCRGRYRGLAAPDGEAPIEKDVWMSW